MLAAVSVYAVLSLLSVAVCSFPLSPLSDWLSPDIWESPEETAADFTDLSPHRQRSARFASIGDQRDAVVGLMVQPETAPLHSLEPTALDNTESGASSDDSLRLPETWADGSAGSDDRSLSDIGFEEMMLEDDAGEARARVKRKKAEPGMDVAVESAGSAPDASKEAEGPWSVDLMQSFAASQAERFKRSGNRSPAEEPTRSEEAQHEVRPAPLGVATIQRPAETAAQGNSEQPSRKTAKYSSYHPYADEWKVRAGRESDELSQSSDDVSAPSEGENLMGDSENGQLAAVEDVAPLEADGEMMLNGPEGDAKAKRQEPASDAGAGADAYDDDSESWLLPGNGAELYKRSEDDAISSDQMDGRVDSDVDDSWDAADSEDLKRGERSRSDGVDAPLGAVDAGVANVPAGYQDSIASDTSVQQDRSPNSGWANAGSQKEKVAHSRVGSQTNTRSVDNYSPSLKLDAHDENTLQEQDSMFNSGEDNGMQAKIARNKNDAGSSADKQFAIEANGNPLVKESPSAGDERSESMLHTSGDDGEYYALNTVEKSEGEVESAPVVSRAAVEQESSADDDWEEEPAVSSHKSGSGKVKENSNGAHAAPSRSKEATADRAAMSFAPRNGESDEQLNGEDDDLFYNDGGLVKDVQSLEDTKSELSLPSVAQDSAVLSLNAGDDGVEHNRNMRDWSSAVKSDSMAPNKDEMKWKETNQGEEVSLSDSSQRSAVASNSLDSKVGAENHRSAEISSRRDRESMNGGQENLEKISDLGSSPNLDRHQMEAVPQFDGRPIDRLKLSTDNEASLSPAEKNLEQKVLEQSYDKRFVPEYKEESQASSNKDIRDNSKNNQEPFSSGQMSSGYQELSPFEDRETYSQEQLVAERSSAFNSPQKLTNDVSPGFSELSSIDQKDTDKRVGKLSANSHSSSKKYGNDMREDKVLQGSAGKLSGRSETDTSHKTGVVSGWDKQDPAMAVENSNTLYDSSEHDVKQERNVDSDTEEKEKRYPEQMLVRHNRQLLTENVERSSGFQDDAGSNSAFDFSVDESGGEASFLDGDSSGSNSVDGEEALSFVDDGAVADSSNLVAEEESESEDSPNYAVSELGGASALDEPGEMNAFVEDSAELDPSGSEGASLIDNPNVAVADSGLVEEDARRSLRQEESDSWEAPPAQLDASDDKDAGDLNIERRGLWPWSWGQGNKDPNSQDAQEVGKDEASSKEYHYTGEGASNSNPGAPMTPMGSKATGAKASWANSDNTAVKETPEVDSASGWTNANDTGAAAEQADGRDLQSEAQRRISKLVDSVLSNQAAGEASQDPKSGSSLKRDTSVSILVPAGQDQSIDVVQRQRTRKAGKFRVRVADDRYHTRSAGDDDVADVVVEVGGGDDRWKDSSDLQQLNTGLGATGDDAAVQDAELVGSSVAAEGKESNLAAAEDRNSQGRDASDDSQLLTRLAKDSRDMQRADAAGLALRSENSAAADGNVAARGGRSSDGATRDFGGSDVNQKSSRALRSLGRRTAGRFQTRRTSKRSRNDVKSKKNKTETKKKRAKTNSLKQKDKHKSDSKKTRGGNKRRQSN